MRRTLFALVVCSFLSSVAAAPGPRADQPLPLPGLQAAVTVSRDTFGIAHIKAGNDHDLYFAQGYVHAQDRLFQMDVNRRRASGTLAELLGPGALAGDVELRTIGIRRAAQRSLSVISPEARAAAEAYAAGVNAYVAGLAQLPPEYQALEITKFQPWTALDALTVAKSITFSLSFGLDDIQNTIALQMYSTVFDPVLGPGTGFTLFSEDLWRSQPFYLASTVPDASAGTATLARGSVPGLSHKIDALAAGLGAKYLDRVRDLPFFKKRLDRDNRPGSNQWAVSGRHTANGVPLVANDPHLALDAPSTFYPIHLTAGDADVMGSGFAGVPFVIVGQTRNVAWGATVSPLDVTDVYLEKVVADAASPSGLSTIYMGNREWVIPVPESYRANVVGDGVPNNLVVVPPGGAIPPATLIVPRRNHGPIVQLDLAAGVALSVQYTGFSGTREVDTFWTWNRARNLEDFKRGLQWFDSGTQNFAYADIQGNIAYFATAEVPLREDLQASSVAGLPPWFIRNGTGGNEWLPALKPQPEQAVPYEILPADEMPHLINPPAGWFVNANNDPAGTSLDNNPLNQLRPGGGLYYLNPGYDFGLRAGRITELIRGKVAEGRVSFRDMQEIQSDVVLPDAPYFVPLITQALARGAVSSDPLLRGLAGQPAVQAAIARLASWNFKASTGIAQGYDAADRDGVLDTPTSQEVAESVAATLYNVWRGQFIRNTVDATLQGAPLPPGVSLPRPGSQLVMTALKGLLERPQPGVGASGINFFNAPAASAADRRDILILKSMADALTLLAGPDFAPAFGGSTNMDDYRWGKLHRIVMDHPLDGQFDLPPAFGLLPHPLGAALPGFPTDGGFGAVDASNHEARAKSANEFMFGNGPVNRFVAEAGRPSVHAESVWPGGTSALPNSPFYVNLLPRYLTNDTVPLYFGTNDLPGNVHSVSRFVPAK
ncbi:MAG TPA: penicillin acylase family protein [Burkholderiaceae bacterium]|nr:penicillin acylase family protein [Burkholderiaceae bacterium]